MPLQRVSPGASRKARDAARSANIRELAHKYEQTGSIGTSKPKSKRAAIKQAVAISYAVERRGEK